MSGVPTIGLTPTGQQFSKSAFNRFQRITTSNWIFVLFGCLYMPHSIFILWGPRGTTKSNIILLLPSLLRTILRFRERESATDSRFPHSSQVLQSIQCCVVERAWCCCQGAVDPLLGYQWRTSYLSLKTFNLGPFIGLFMPGFHVCWSSLLGSCLVSLLVWCLLDLLSSKSFSAVAPPLRKNKQVLHLFAHTLFFPFFGGSSQLSSVENGVSGLITGIAFADRCVYLDGLSLICMALLLYFFTGV